MQPKIQRPLFQAELFLKHTPLLQSRYILFQDFPPDTAILLLKAYNLLTKNTHKTNAVPITRGNTGLL